MFFVSACKKEEDTTNSTPNYSYSETDNGVIKNASFAYGTVGATNTSFPKTSLTGWTLTKESSAKSGVVSTAKDAWTELMKTLYSDSGILNYLKEVENEGKGFTTDDVKSAIKTEKGDENYSPTSDDIKTYILDKYYNREGSRFTNPGTHEGALDNRVYMLNNYTSGWIGAGSTQKLTSSTEITLNKGEYAKVSVWVYTANIKCATDNNAGANIRISNSFNGSSQKDYGIFNINTNNTWKQYTFYIHADEVYETKFTLVLGLGYDDVDVEGTVYFDDIIVEHKTEKELNNETSTKNFDKQLLINNYNAEEPKTLEAQINDSQYDAYLYDMAIDVTSIKDQNFITNVNRYFTTSESGESGGKFYSTDKNDNPFVNNLEGVPYGITEGLKIKLDRQSYTLTLKNGNAPFSVGPEEYVTVNFFVKNKLSKFSSTTLTVDVWDGPEGAPEKRSAVATLNEVSDEWQKLSILVKNNFDKNASPAYNAQFYLNLVIGTTDVKSNNVSDYATGTVYITNPFITTGKTYQYEDADETIETDNYKYYKLLSGTASGSTSLYAGYSSDYVADEDDTETYSLTVAPSEMGVIINNPAQPKNYKGIDSKHFYINPEEEVYAINTNANAGLINSKYPYGGTDYISKLAYDNSITDSEIQPLMIYNETADSYGYIGNTNTIAASAYAKVSVKVRVADTSAAAYVYLVDTSNTIKSVMNFDELKENLDFSLKVTSDMMEDDGWTTVEFFVATGANAKNFRVEVWNGSRDGANKSEGYVFFNDITVTTSGAFTEPTKIGELNSSPLNGKDIDDSNIITYKRALTDLEKKFNTEVEKGKVDAETVKYIENYVWAKNDKLVYAVFNTIDPVEVDPYEAIEKDEEETEEEEETFDASTFWLSFSSILLGVALAFALVMLLIKNIRRRRKANASDAKSHYTVTSRTRKKVAPKTSEEKEEVVEETPLEEVESNEESESETEKEQTLDEYVYDDVQVFGEDENTSEETISSDDDTKE